MKNSNTQLTTQEWYTNLVDECKAIITEAVFTHNWSLVEGYHNLGQRILEDYPNFERAKIYGKEIAKRVSESLGKSQRVVEKSIQFAKKYPDISVLPDGKTITVRKVFNELLPESKEEIEIQIPKGKYSTIVIDPPWQVEFMELEMRPNQFIMPYPTMSIEEIKDFPINDFAAENCNLFIWTTHTYLPRTFEILEAWGFKYHVCLTWDKTNGRSLFGFNRRTEFCLYAYKGKITVNQRGKFIDTIFTEKLREHSRKPDIFYEMLKSNTPEPRIDVFSREKRDGFDQFGNEEDKFNGN